MSGSESGLELEPEQVAGAEAVLLEDGADEAVAAQFGQRTAIGFPQVAILLADAIARIAVAAAIDDVVGRGDGRERLDIGVRARLLELGEDHVVLDDILDPAL